MFYLEATISTSGSKVARVRFVSGTPSPPSLPLMKARSRNDKFVRIREEGEKNRAGGEDRGFFFLDFSCAVPERIPVRQGGHTASSSPHLKCPLPLLGTGRSPLGGSHLEEPTCRTCGGSPAEAVMKPPASRKLTLWSLFWGLSGWWGSYFFMLFRSG